LGTAPTKPDGDFDDAVADVAFNDPKVFEDHCVRSGKIMTAMPLDHVIPRSLPTQRLVQFAVDIPLSHRGVRARVGDADLLRERIVGATGGVTPAESNCARDALAGGRTQCVNL
jgi:hypothetical protein